MNTFAELSKYVLSLILDFALASLPRVLLFSFLSFVVSIIGLVMLGRRGAFRRKPKPWNVLSKLAYVYIPIVLMLSAVALGLLTSAHGLVEKRVKKELSPLVCSNLPTVRTWLMQRVDWKPGHEYSLDEAARMVLEPLYHQPASNGLVERARARITNYVSMNVGKWIITAGLAAVLTYAAGRAGEAIGLDEETIKFSIDVIREMDLSRVDDSFGEIFQRALLSTANKVFKALYLKVVLVTLAALAVPALDVGIYFLWYRRRSRAAVAPAS